MKRIAMGWQIGAKCSESHKSPIQTIKSTHGDSELTEINHEILIQNLFSKFEIHIIGDNKSKNEAKMELVCLYLLNK